MPICKKVDFCLYTKGGITSTLATLICKFRHIFEKREEKERECIVCKQKLLILSRVKLTISSLFFYFI